MLAACAAVGAANDPPAAPAPTRWNAAPPAVPPPSLPPAPNVLPRFTPPPPPPGIDPSRMVLFQKPAEPPPTKPAALPQPAPAAQPPIVLKDPIDKNILLEVFNPSFRPGPPAALPRAKVSQLLSDDELRKRILDELAEEQFTRDLRDWQAKKDDDPTKGPKPTLEQVRARLKFPDTPPVGKPGDAYVTKVIREAYPAGRLGIEPVYVVHRKLYFEELNAERYGWDTGFAQPIVSTLAFYKDVLLWPAKLASYPCERYDVSAGKCLPGNPVPYYLYPQEISLFGATVGAGAIIGTAGFVFP